MTSPDIAAGSARSAYALLGGAEGVREAVDAFYRRVLADEHLTHFFAGVQLPRLKRHQVLILTEILGGPVGYTGVGLAAGHAGLAITPTDFERVAGHLLAALEGPGADPHARGIVTDALTSVRPQIVTAAVKPGAPQTSEPATSG